MSFALGGFVCVSQSKQPALHTSVLANSPQESAATRNPTETDSKKPTQHAVDGVQRTTPATSDTLRDPRQKNARDESGSKCNEEPVQYLGWCPPVLGSVARQFWGWSPLREVPARESRRWPRHSHNVAGTSTCDSGPGIHRDAAGTSTSVLPTLSQWVPASLQLAG